ncbi:tetratricopeptide repeat protein [Nocardia sp. NPDC004860]|uniref:tetratricopeptide repeat protein n=1 Tax=Nocardia sp. NPDC004860 TaxID=3154557 RepID=UPI0033B1A6C6
MKDHDARNRFFADLDQLRREAGSPEVQIIARGSGIRETTIRGWFPTEPTERRVVPRSAEQLITLVTYLLRRSNKLAARASMDRRTQESWLHRRRAAASENTTPRDPLETTGGLSNNGDMGDHDSGVAPGWGGIAAVLDTDTDLPLMSELDAYRLGSTPTRFGYAWHSGDLDPYVPRTADGIDTRIANALSGSAMVLVTGWSMVGKTRTLFEAVRRELSDAKVLVPARTALQTIPTHLAYTQSSDTIVVWLDDLDEYLQSEQKLTPTWLTHMQTAHPGRTVVVATMRREAFERLETDSGEPTREIRALLDQATQIRLESTSDNSTEHSAAETDYPDLGLEQYRALGYGLGEVLAGAPALLARYDRADPPLRAAIEVAVDWRRIGRPDPIPEPTLVKLAALRARMLRPSMGLDTANIEKAILTAREPVEATARIAALHTLWSNETDCGYRAFDYLVAADDGQHGSRKRPIPEAFWDAATSDAGPDILVMVSFTAHTRGHHEHVLRIARRAASTGATEGVLVLGFLLHERGEFAEAETWYRRATDNGNTDAMGPLGLLLDKRGEHAEAETWLRRAADTGDTRAIINIGVHFDKQGDLTEAETWYRRAADTGNTSAMIKLGTLFSRRGDLVESETWYRRAVEAGDTDAIGTFGFLLSTRGDLAEAETWYRRAADSGDAALMVTVGSLSEKRGDLTEAETWYRRAADAGKTSAMVLLAQLLVARGNGSEAATWLERSAANCDADEMFSLGNLFEERGDFTEAETWYRRATDNGNTRAMIALARLHENHDDPAEAETWYRRAADAGDVSALFYLGMVLVKRGGNSTEAEAILHRAVDGGDINAMVVLGKLHEIHGDLGQAETWYRRAADMGIVAAMAALDHLLHNRGTDTEAESDTNDTD